MVLTVVETFCGARGLHLGFKRNGFRPLLLNDIDKRMIRTMKMNHSEYDDSVFFCGRIQDITVDVLPTDPVDVLAGGIVCKGFSGAGYRNPVDERNYLYLEQLRLVNLIRPKISLIENIPLFKTSKIVDRSKCPDELIIELNDLYTEQKRMRSVLISKRGDNIELKRQWDANLERIRNVKKQVSEYYYSVFGDVLQRYDALGYIVFHKILNSADYGDFTSRKRLFIVAVRSDIYEDCGDFEFPLPSVETHRTADECFDKIDYEDESDVFNEVANTSKETIEKFKAVTTEVKIRSCLSFQRVVPDKPVRTLTTCKFPLHPIDTLPQGKHHVFKDSN